MMIRHKDTFVSLIIFISLSAHHVIHAFSPFVSMTSHPTFASLYSTTIHKHTHLYTFIEADSVDDIPEPNPRGVGRAMENAIILSGNVDSKGVAFAQDIEHYRKVIPWNGDVGDSSSSSSSISGTKEETHNPKRGMKVLCKGEGVEIYKDPGETTVKSITLAPISAVENALKSSVLQVDRMESGEKMLITFSGGDDLMVHEVLEGVQNLVQELKETSSSSSSSWSSDGKVQFRSLCEPSFPMEKCGVAAMIVGNDSDGHVYYNEGKWYTVSQEDLVD